MSNLGTMKTRIADELRRDDLVSRIGAAITSAIRYYESERFWFTEGESTASTVAGEQNIAVPTDLIEPDQLTYTDSNSYRYPLKRRSWSWYRRNQEAASNTAPPTDWCIYADQIWLYPTPDAVYTLTLSYLKRLDALSAYADTNAWMTHGEELIRSHAKYDLLCNHALPDPATAQMTNARLQMIDRELQRALDNLRNKSSRRIATDRLSLDPALVGSGSYNINLG